MAKKRNKIIVKTNLDTATYEQKERFIQILIKAHRILYKSVVERRAKSILNVECRVDI